MGANKAVALSDHFSEFVAHEVDSGHYSSSQEVVEAALRLLEDRDVRLEALRMAIAVETVPVSPRRSTRRRS